jgi:hypothetical protein
MYRTIDTCTWDDPWVTDLRPLDKLLFFYLLTNRRSTACGVFEITLDAMAFETGLSSRQVTDGLVRLAPKIVWWPEHRVIFIRNFFKHQSAQSNVANFTSAAAKKLLDFPWDVRELVIEIYPTLYKEVTHTHPIPMPPPTLGDKVEVTVEVEEEVEKQKNHARAKAARSFPDDFTISDEMRFWAKKNVPGLDILAATEQWRDAMRSNTTKYKYTDWEAAWRTGMTRALSWGGNGNGTNYAQGAVRPGQQGGLGTLAVPKSAGPGQALRRPLADTGPPDEDA